MKKQRKPHFFGPKLNFNTRFMLRHEKRLETSEKSLREAPKQVARLQGWKLLSCSNCQELGQPASWLLIGYTGVKQPTRSQISSLTQLLTWRELISFCHRTCRSCLWRAWRPRRPNWSCSTRPTGTEWPARRRSTSSSPLSTICRRNCTRLVWFGIIPCLLLFPSNNVFLCYFFVFFVFNFHVKFGSILGRVRGR